MSLKSMTAFGNGEVTREGSNYRCEIRTLNSRFCEVNIKLPRFLIGLEPSLMNLVKAQIIRGKVDIFVDVSSLDRTAGLAQLNAKAVEHYLKLGQELSQNAGIELKPLSTAEFLRLEGVLQTLSSSSNEDPISLHETGIIAVVNEALAKIKVHRTSEGTALSEALVKLLDSMQTDREAIASKRSVIQQQLFATYRKRLDRLLNSLEENGLKLKPILPEERVLGEIAILIERADIEEELTRLEAHEDEFRRLLKVGEEIGRRSDFLCQEMHREVNTISSKLTQLDVSKHSMNLKQTVERLRQQVANIE